MPNGILVIDKPADWTSHDVVGKVRRLLQERRVGHAGTLDPMATGVLPVFVGRATRAVEFAMEGEKEYVAGLRLGVVTDTQDITGTVLEERPLFDMHQAVDQVLERFRGELLQVPPMYSALKVKGQKLYELARKGVEVERPPRRVTIHSLKILEQLNNGDYILKVRCSKGTYVRTLCHDMGQALGCGAAMSSLRRTEAAGFTIHQAVTMEEAEERGAALLLPVDRFFAACPSFTIWDPEQERRCRCGNPLREPGLSPGLYRVYGRAGDFLCLSRYENGVLTSVKNFFGP